MRQARPHAQPGSGPQSRSLTARRGATQMAEARLAHALQALQPQPAGGQEQQTSPPQTSPPQQTSPQAQRHVLVAGATGVVGRAAVEEFESRGTRVTMVSRRKPAYSTTATHIALDLSDRAGCHAALASLG